MSDYYVVEPCTTANGFEIKLKRNEIDLSKAAEALARLGRIAGESKVVLLVSIGKGASLSVYSSGRMLLKGDVSGKAEAEKLASEIYAALKGGGAII